MRRVRGSMSWRRVLAELPLIAILRGLPPKEAPAIAEALMAAGFLCLEVPLNSTLALESITRLRRKFDGALLIGAGTVLTTEQVSKARDAGAEFIVSPNTDIAVIRATKQYGLVSLPGFATPSEAFAASQAGADALKLFPAEAASPVVLGSLKAVLPRMMPVLPVGGITPASMKAYAAVGAAGFGIGSAIYMPGADPQPVRQRAQRYVKAWQALGR